MESKDLVTWTIDSLPSAGHPHAIVIAGTQGTPVDVAISAPNERLTWTSRDGIEWPLAQGPSAPIEGLASGPAGVLGLIGTWDDAGSVTTGFQVWRLVAQPAS